MEFEVVNAGGNRRVAIFSKRTFGGIFDDPENILSIAKFCNIEVHIFETNDHRFYNFSSYENHLVLNVDVKIKNVYSYITNYIKNNKIEACLFLGSGFPWTGEFLKDLKKYSYAACYFSDDPEGSENTSRYYVKNFHYAFCGGVYFDEKNTVEDKYRQWGARKAMFIPLGANLSKYKNPINDLKERKNDLVYVGGCYFPKVIRMFWLKRHFGDRMLMYGRGWNSSNSRIKTLILRFLKFVYRVPFIEELPKNKLVELYQNTKIGFNIHMSYGPSNQRLYELPINGVMQLCDCKKGLSRIYKIGEEVVSYDNISDAIKKIEYYLHNDEERRKIAQSGYKKAIEHYKSEDCFLRIFNEIFKDVKDFKNKIY